MQVISNQMEFTVSANGARGYDLPLRDLFRVARGDDVLLTWQSLIAACCDGRLGIFIYVLKSNLALRHGRPERSVGRTW